MALSASLPATSPPRDGDNGGAEDGDGSKYASRLSRAREANNFARRTNGGALSNSEGLSPMMLRSPSQVEHDLRNRLAGTRLGNGPPPAHSKTGGTSPLKLAGWGVVATQRTNASAVRPGLVCFARALVFGLHRTRLSPCDTFMTNPDLGQHPPAALCRQATRMEAEVDRNEFGDCREMVRDITSAALPTRSELAARAERERGGEHVNLSWRGAAKQRGIVVETADIDGESVAEEAGEDEEAVESSEKMGLSWKSATSTGTGSAAKFSFRAPMSPALSVPEQSISSSEEGESEVSLFTPPSHRRPELSRVSPAALHAA